MTPDDDHSIIDAFHAVFGRPTFTLPRDPLADLDEATLRRSRGGLSRTARAESRRPFVRREPEPWADSVAGCDVHGVAS